MNKITTGDNIPDLGSKDADTVSRSEWQPLHFTAHVAAPSPPSFGISPPPPSSTTTVSVSVTRDGSPIFGPSSFTSCRSDRVDVSPCSEYCTTSSSRRRRSRSSCTTCESKCHQQGGFYTNSVCTRFSQLDKVGVLVQADGTSTTGFAPDNDDSHTAYDSYHTVDQCSPYPDAFDVELRSSGDPYVKSLELTGWTTPPDFGNTPAENASAGITLVVLGLAIIAGDIAAAYAIYKCSCKNKRVGPGVDPVINQISPLSEGIYSSTQYPMASAAAIPMQPQMPIATAVPVQPQQMQPPPQIAQPSAPPML